MASPEKEAARPGEAQPIEARPVAARPIGRLEVVARILSGSILAVFAGMLVLTWSSLNAQDMQRDWVVWQHTGSLWWQGRVAEIYPRTFENGNLFPYPPYAIYFFALLAIAPVEWFQLSLVITCTIALGLTLALLWQAIPGDRGQYITIGLVTFASAPWLSMLIAGQLSAFYLLFMAAGLLTWRKGYLFATGMLWSVLAIKPNVLLPLILCCFVGRHWKILQGFGVGLALWVASTVPMGFGIWSQMYENVAATAGTFRGMPEMLWKHPTLYAFCASLLGSKLPARAVDVIWGLADLLLLALLLRSWYVQVGEERLPRLFGMTLLFVVAGNSYLWFYDGLFIVIPAVAWFLGRSTYRSPGRYAAIGVLLGLAMLWLHLSLFVFKQGPALTGGFLAGWLILESLDFCSTGEQLLEASKGGTA